MSAIRVSQSGKHVTPMFNVCYERPRSDTRLVLERSLATACLPDSLYKNSPIILWLVRFQGKPLSMRRFKTMFSENSKVGKIYLHYICYTRYSILQYILNITYIYRYVS